MTNPLSSAKRFVLFITRLITIPAIAQISIGIAASPGLTATLASSKATVELNNFSRAPLNVLTLTDFSTAADATDNRVVATADTFAAFITDSIPPFASNLSFSTVSGDGNNYSGRAESVAAVIGYNFSVGANENFSFNFKANLDLVTSIEDPQFEEASAAGSLSFQLYDTTNTDNVLLLDDFTLSGNLSTPGNVDFLYYDKSINIFLTSDETALDTAFGGTQEFAEASIDALFSRTFNSSANITLVEFKTNQASVAVPEPSSKVGFLFLCLAVIGYQVRKKAEKKSF